MPETSEDEYMPYAPGISVLNPIRKRFQGSLPDPVTSQLLMKMGVSDGNVPRTLRALQFLGFLDEEGRQTPLFLRMGKATSEEYQEILAGAVTDAYKKVFEIVSDPASATDIQLSNAFKFASPASQRDRMIALFHALCRECGIIEGGPVIATGTPKPVRKAASPGTKKTNSEIPNPQDPDTKGSVPPVVQEPEAEMPEAKRNLAQAAFHLLKGVPDTAIWSKTERDNWVRTFTGVVDIFIKVQDNAPGEERE